MRQNDRHGLRVLTFHEARQQLRLDVLQLPGASHFSVRAGQLVQMLLASFRAEGAGENPFGVCNAAGADASYVRRRIAKLLQNRFRFSSRNRRKICNGAADGLHLFFAELLQQTGRRLIAQSNQKNGRFLCAGESPGAARSRHRELDLPFFEPAAQHSSTDFRIFLSSVAELRGESLQARRR